MKRTTATTERAMRLSLRGALVAVEPKSQLGMPMPADADVRRSFSNAYVSRRSGAV